MPDTISDPKDGSDMTAKRNLPAWKSSKEERNRSGRKKNIDASEAVANHANESGGTLSYEATQDNFSNLLEGVVFAFSGFVNPERSTLRSQAIEMGAEYRPDWTSDCTLLVCAFPNTPKFRQVESECGTVVSKEWISECYNQKKLVDIERYLMHAGRPWRKSIRRPEINQDQKNTQSEEHQKQSERRAHVKQTGSTKPEGGVPDAIKDLFSPSNIKKWANHDLRETMSWLDSQEEKPESDEMRIIAAEGIITCLQDAIESLRENHDILLVIQQWKFVPKVVSELAGLEGSANKKRPLSKKVICELAVTCKRIYEDVFEQLDCSTKNKKPRTDGDEKDKRVQKESDDGGYDSDQTVEMTEEEIELACKQLSS